VIEHQLIILLTWTSINYLFDFEIISAETTYLVLLHLGKPFHNYEIAFLNNHNIVTGDKVFRFLRLII